MEITVGQITWHAKRVGNGSKLMIVFHGYGQESMVMRHFIPLLGDEYQFALVDLAYHGTNQHFPEKFVFDEVHARFFIDELLRQIGSTDFFLFGYSLGARVALTIGSWMPEKTRGLFLLAPDGLPVSNAYRFLTRTKLGVNRFQAFVSAPSLALNLVSAGKSLRFFPKNVASFYTNEILSEEKRQLLFNAWMAYRKAIPDKASLRRQAIEKTITVVCVLGIFDSVIPFELTKKQVKLLFPEARIIELPMGHNLVSEKAVKKLVEVLGNNLPLLFEPKPEALR